jgi:hypothetical protein
MAGAMLTILLYTNMVITFTFIKCNRINHVHLTKSQFNLNQYT